MSDDRLKALAAALGRVPSGLFIVTARKGEAETGLLASWVQQCSFDPPQVSLCLRRGREMNAWLEDGAAFTVNILEDDGGTDLIVRFGRGFALDEPAFEGLEVARPGGRRRCCARRWRTWNAASSPAMTPATMNCSSAASRLGPCLATASRWSTCARAGCITRPRIARRP